MSFLQGHFLSNGEAPFQSIPYVRLDFLKGLALTHASGNCWHLGPVSSLLRRIDQHFQFHGILRKVAKSLPCGSDVTEFYQSQPMQNRAGLSICWQEVAFPSPDPQGTHKMI